MGKALFCGLHTLTAISSSHEVCSPFDKVYVIIRGIKSHVGEVDYAFSCSIVFHITCYLDKRTREDFEFSFQQKRLPTFEDLRRFLQNHSFIVEEKSTRSSAVKNAKILMNAKSKLKFSNLSKPTGKETSFSGNVTVRKFVL